MCLMDTRTGKKLVRKQSGFNAFTREFLHEGQILDQAKFVVYILPFKLKNSSCPFIPQKKLVEVQRSFAPSQKSGGTCLSQRDAYKKVATDSGSAVSLPPADKQVKKIIRNTMKQVG